MSDATIAKRPPPMTGPGLSHPTLRLSAAFESWRSVHGSAGWRDDPAAVAALVALRDLVDVAGFAACALPPRARARASADVEAVRGLLDEVSR